MTLVPYDYVPDYNKGYVPSQLCNHALDMPSKSATPFTRVNNLVSFKAFCTITEFDDITSALCLVSMFRYKSNTLSCTIETFHANNNNN